MSYGRMQSEIERLEREIREFSAQAEKIDAKEARSFRRFSLRGQKKVAAEWTLVSLCGNLLKLVNYRLAEQHAGTAAS